MNTEIRNENIGGKNRKKNKESINGEKTKTNTQTLQVLGIWCTALINSEKLSCWMMRQPVGSIFTA